MTIDRLYNPGKRRIVAWLGNTPPPAGRQAFEVREFAVTPCSSPELRDASYVSLLAAVVLAQLARDLGREKVTLSPEAIQKLVAYSWPGNIRELRNVLERAIMLADKSRIEPQDFGLEGVQAGRNTGPPHGLQNSDVIQDLYNFSIGKRIQFDGEMLAFG